MGYLVLVDWVLDQWRAGAVTTVDPRLGGDFVEHEASMVLRLGLLCSQLLPRRLALCGCKLQDNQRCKEEHADALSLEDLLNATTMEESPAASLPHDTVMSSPPPGRCLSSSPIWKRRDFMWGITFYTIEDVRGYFRTYPHVGGPFQSRDEANEAIDRYLTDHTDFTMGTGLSEVDKIVQRCRYFPDGTKKRLKAGQPIDKRRDTYYQLSQALVDKYNDHHNLVGDLAYEVKDVLKEPSLWEEENSKMCMHMNFTAKTKGSDGLDAGSDNLFFAEVTYGLRDKFLTVNCCCIVNPSDNGPCFGCRWESITMKHPNGNAYTGGRKNVLYCLPFGSLFPVEVPWCYDEDSDEEVERLRCLYAGVRRAPRTTEGTS